MDRLVSRILVLRTLGSATVTRQTSRRVVVVCMTLAFGFAGLGCGRRGGAQREAEVRAVDELRVRALHSGDVKTLRELYADDFVMVTSGGQLRSKGDQLRDIASGAVRHPMVSERILTVRLYGEVAVLLAESSPGSVVMNGAADERARRYTRVYVWRDGRWQLVTTHVSVVSGSVVAR